MKLQGIVLKLLFLALINGTSLWAALTLFSLENYGPIFILAFTTLFIDFIYLSKRTKASRWLIPGTVLLVIFQIYPVLYTAVTAFSNYSTGHSISRDEAIQSLIDQNTNAVESGASFSFVALESGTRRSLLLSDEINGTYAIADEKSFKKVATGEIPPGFTEISQTKLRQADVQKWLTFLRIPYSESTILKVDSFNTASEYRYILRYDKSTDKLIDIESGQALKEKDGSFFYLDGTELDPGWKIWVGFKNFSDVVSNERIRGPFFRVLICISQIKAISYQH